MSCDAWRDAIVDAARQPGEPGAALDAHLGSCAGCRARLDRERELTAGLRALAASTAADRPSAALEERLLAAFDAHHAAGRHRWRPLVAAAAAVLIVAGVVSRAWDAYQEAHHAAAQTAAVSSEFVPWPGARALPPFESGQLVRTELPASVLPLLGLTTTDVTGTTVAADVLVGQDGLARAVRLAHEPRPEAERRSGS